MKKQYTFKLWRVLSLGLLLNIILVTASCGQRATKTNTDRPNNITVIVTSQDTLFYYDTENKPKPGQIITRQQLVTRLKNSAEKWGDSILTTIKPTAHAGLQSTFVIIEEFKKNKMGRFEVANLTKNEKEIFGADNPELMPPVTVIDEPSNDTGYAEIYHHFYIEIKADSSVWYQPVAPEIRTRPLQVNDPVKENLKTAIGQFEKMYPGIKKSFIIRGHKNAGNPIFQTIVQALKESNINNYQLETSQD